MIVDGFPVDRSENVFVSLPSVMISLSAAALGVANIEVSYSGYGDDGSIDGIQYRDPTGIRVDRATIPEKLIEDLESCVYTYLPAGFEIGEGAQGTLTIDVGAAKVTIQHQENYTESHDSTREFTL